MLKLVTNNLQAAREERGYTQSALARSSGVKQPTISAIEVGRYIPRLDTALRLARSLKVYVEDIFGI